MPWIRRQATFQLPIVAILVVGGKRHLVGSSQLCFVFAHESLDDTRRLEACFIFEINMEKGPHLILRNGGGLKCRLFDEIAVGIAVQTIQ